MGSTGIAPTFDTEPVTLYSDIGTNTMEWNVDSGTIEISELKLLLIENLMIIPWDLRNSLQQDLYNLYAVVETQVTISDSEASHIALQNPISYRNYI